MYNTPCRRYNRNYKMSTHYSESSALNMNTLCIPRVFPNIRENRIRGVIAALQMCDIEKIDMVSRVGEKGEKYNRVFIHIKNWYNNENAQAAQNRLSVGKDIKIVYDDPWFWKVSTYRKTLPVNNSSRLVKQPPHMVFDDDEEKKAPINKAAINKASINKAAINKASINKASINKAAIIMSLLEKKVTTKTIPLDTSVSQMISDEMLDREYDVSVGPILDYGQSSKAIPKKKLMRPRQVSSSSKPPSSKPLSIMHPDDLAAVYTPS